MQEYPAYLSYRHVNVSLQLETVVGWLSQLLSESSDAVEEIEDFASE